MCAIMTVRARKAKSEHVLNINLLVLRVSRAQWGEPRHLATRNAESRLLTTSVSPRLATGHARTVPGLADCKGADGGEFGTVVPVNHVGAGLRGLFSGGMCISKNGDHSRLTRAHRVRLGPLCSGVSPGRSHVVRLAL
jgi:hypothetical protein